MARELDRLTALEVKRKRAPGRYPDGGGLYLQVTGDGDSATAKSWLFRYMLRGKQRWMGLGSVGDVTLADARQLAVGYRRMVRDGIDPVDARKKQRQAEALAAASAVTFRQAAESYITAHEAGWRNAKHCQQWKNTLATYAYPILGTLSIQAVDTGLVVKVLEPIWTTKPETGSRVRGRIETVLGYATAHHWRQGANPARWKGHLENILPKSGKVKRTRHHPALPYDRVAEFMTELRQQSGASAAALEFAILTAARTKEVRFARWGEIDRAASVWIVPPERMKADREHRVPLPKRALAILDEMAKLRPNAKSDDYIFPGGKRGKPLSDNALAAVIDRMNETEDGAPVWIDRHGDPIVPHGFRSTFRDWAADCTNFPNHVVEAALAHAVSDKVEAAYRRGDLFQKRRQLMDAWARFVATHHKRGEVVQLPARTAEKAGP